MTLSDIIPLLQKEMDYADSKYGPYHNSHEHYAVLQEEVDEWWDAVKGNFSYCAMYELIQVAAVALRFVIENNTLDLEDIQRMRHLK
jgi:hypothetical protein